MIVGARMNQTPDDKQEQTPPENEEDPPLCLYCDFAMARFPAYYRCDWCAYSVLVDSIRKARLDSSKQAGFD